MTITVIVCAHDEEHYIGPCLHSLRAQTRLPDEILVVDNASTDRTSGVASAIPGVRVVAAPRKGLVVARERGRLEARGDLLVYIDADCRAPLAWLARVERQFLRQPALIALSGNYRFYDWDWWGRTLLRAYDFTLGPATHVLVKYVLGIGVVFYGGNFAVRREALERIGGFDVSIEFHGEDHGSTRLPRLASIVRTTWRWPRRAYPFRTTVRCGCIGRPSGASSSAWSPTTSRSSTSRRQGPSGLQRSGLRGERGCRSSAAFTPISKPTRRRSAARRGWGAA